MHSPKSPKSPKQNPRFALESGEGRRRAKTVTETIGRVEMARLMGRVEENNASPKRRRAFSDPGYIASWDASIMWEKENETDTEFLRAALKRQQSFSTPAVDVEESNEYLWTEDKSVAYILCCEKDGSTTFAIRKGKLRAIVEQIVLWLIRPPGSSKNAQKGVESQLQNFLCAHERVISTEYLLGMLSEIYFGKNVENKILQENEKIRREGVFNFACFWLDFSYYPDFVRYDGESCAEEMAALHQFITGTFSTTSAESKERRKQLMDKIRVAVPWLQKQTGSPSPELAMSPRSARRKEKQPDWYKKPVPSNFLDFSILDVTEEDAAINLTRIDARMMRSIRRTEIVSKKFETLKTEDPTAAYVIYVERLRKFGFWIATQIVNDEIKTKVRARLFRKWVLIAKQCILVNNFSSTCAILAGLNHQAITRMTTFLQTIPEDVMKLKTEMDDNFMGFSDNYARSLINECILSKVACIPTIDVLRKDLLRIDEGSKGDEEDGLVKFFKIVSFGKAIHFIEQAYSQQFPFEKLVIGERDAHILEWLAQMPNTVKSVQALMKRSFQIERPTEKELKASVYKGLISTQSTEKSKK